MLRKMFLFPSDQYHRGASPKKHSCRRKKKVLMKSGLRCAIRFARLISEEEADEIYLRFPKMSDG